MSTKTLFVSSREYFAEVVDSALSSRRMDTFPSAKDYLIRLLEFHVPAEHLFDEFDEQGRRQRSTLAEAYLRAMSSEPAQRVELLKRTADRALYISGFFSDSLQRKLVDVDYYADMGVAAYSSLAENVRDDISTRVYREYSRRFTEFMDVLAWISSQSKQQSEANILRLYEAFARTGSEYAREQLLERGLIAVPLSELEKSKKQ